MKTSNQIGFWSAAALALVGVLYMVTLAAGFARHGMNEPITDPVLAIMEWLTLFSALPIITLMVAVADGAPSGRRGFGLAALAFATLCAGITSTVHFLELTAVRQLGEVGIQWPSRVYAAELLAWDVFLGLALLFAAPVFVGAGPQRRIRWGLIVCGILCLAGAVGPVVGNMRLQLVGVLGYAVVLPIVCILMAREYMRRNYSGETNE